MSDTYDKWKLQGVINILRAENEKLREERDTIGEANYVSGWNGAINSSEEMQDLRAENEKLRAATLEDAAMLVDRMKNEIANGQGEYSLACIQIARRLRAAAAALKETGDE